MSHIIAFIAFVVSDIFSYRWRLEGQANAALRAFVVVHEQLGLSLEDLDFDKYEKFCNKYVFTKKIPIWCYLPIINMFIALIYKLYCLTSANAPVKYIDKYHDEIVRIIKEIPSQEELIEDIEHQMELENAIDFKRQYFVRYGQDGAYNTIYFTINEIGDITITEVSGPDKALDEDTLAYKIIDIGNAIACGDDEDYGYSKELKTIFKLSEGLMAAEFEETPILEPEQEMVRKRKKQP